MKRRWITAAFACGAAALLGLAASQARAGDPAPFAPLPAGPTPAALPAGTDARAPAAPLPKAPEPPSAAAPDAPRPDVTTRATLATPPPATLIVAPPAPAACAPACEEPCLKKVCVPEQAVRTIDRRVYGDVCEDFCVPKCSLFGGLSGFGHHKHDDCGACPADGCGQGGCASCEHHVRQRKYLVVKIKHEEECYTKCNVAYEPEAPKCPHGACEAPAACAGAVVPPPPAPMPPVEKAPPPKEKK